MDEFECDSLGFELHFNYSAACTTCQYANIEGINQWGKKDYLEDDAFRAAFQQYSQEKNGSGLTPDEQIFRIEKEFGLQIKRRKLFDIRKRLGIESIRKNVSTTAEERTQAVIDAKSHDLAGKWGVAQVRRRLADQGTLVKRDEIRQILHDHFDAELPRTMASATCRREALCSGSEDGGHNFTNLCTKDQFSNFVPYMRCLPSVRLSNVIGHVFLDLVKEYGCVPIPLTTTDKGSEVGDMVRCQERLRLHAAPEFTLDQWPASKQVQSKHNTPIEGFWRWKRDGEGHSMRQTIFVGRDAGLFNSNNPLHASFQLAMATSCPKAPVSVPIVLKQPSLVFAKEEGSPDRDITSSRIASH
ncbi:hypothetical protein BDR05DRAFT_1005611 [Suillus weaverae]|nr:hypothetical protein BDR05DRAFT_1005611 [Suillus weaverae]